MNSYSRIYTLLTEGKTTGGEGTADRLGRWYRGINPEAKPGKKGYMRKRNVPRASDKYDPTKHKAPVTGKPLRYMKPQHRDMTIARINTRIGAIAKANAERRGGSKNVIHAEKKKGEKVLDKYGVPRPSVAQMMAKWIKGNNPWSKDNPEGYIRSN